MQILKDLLVKGKAFIEGLPVFGSGSLTALVLDGTEIKKKTLGSMALKQDTDYLDGISVSFPSFLYVTASPQAPDSSNLSVVLVIQSKNHVFAAPTWGGGTPSFRLLSQGDIPQLAISKISGLQEALDVLTKKTWYLEDSLNFDANRFIRWDLPRYISLANHGSVSDPGAYTFTISILFHLNHRQYVNAAWRHYQLSGRRILEVTLLTDNTTARTKRIAGIKTLSHSGRWVQYNSTGTGVVANGYLDERYIDTRALISDGITPPSMAAGNPVVEIKHNLQNHPGFADGVSYLLYAKYTVDYDTLKTSQTT